MLKISFLFLNYNSFEHIERNVKFLDQNASSFSGISCVVVNNDCSQVVSLQVDNIEVKVIESKYNSGYAKGNNLGIEYCRKNKIDFCVVCNPDIEFDNDFLVGLLRLLTRINGDKSYNDVSAISIEQKNLTPYYNEPDLLGYIFPFLVRKNDYAQSHNVSSSQSISNVYRFHGACFVIPIANISKWDCFFREDTFLYMEEDLLSLKSKANGARIIHCHDFKVTHIGGVSTKKSIPWKKYLYYYDGLYIIFREHFSLSKVNASFFSILGSVTRFFLELRFLFKSSKSSKSSKSFL